MKILMLTCQGDLAGSTRSIFDLASGLVACGHSVVIGARPDSMIARWTRKSPMELLPLDFRSKTDIRTAKTIAGFVREREIDVVNSHAARDRYLTVGARWGYRMRSALVHTRRQMPKSSGNFLQNGIYERGTDRIVAVSQAVKTALVRLGLSETHISVIPNGTLLEKYAYASGSDPEALKRELGIEPGRFVIGCVARRKNQETILEAIAKMPNAPPMTALFIGIDRLPNLAKLEQSIPDRHQTIYHGEIDNPLPYYRMMDVFVLPSRIEGLSQALMEAMMNRAPCIGFDAGGNGELIEHEKTGLLVPPLDAGAMAGALERVMRDPGEAKKWGVAARRKVESERGMDHTVGMTEALFDRLIERRHDARR